jgi:hypothetical protein
MGTEEQAMSNSALMQQIEGQLLADYAAKYGDPDDDLKTLVHDAIVKAVIAYRKDSADRTIYETSLGSFIIEQNPYTSWENLVFPNLPVNPDGENSWVRKSGVLAEYHASRPLPKDQPIPGGMVVDFSYADWKYLRDPEEPRDGASAEGFAEPFTLNERPEAPESDPARSPGLPPQFTYFFGHNIVKSVRLKYKFLDRRYTPAEAEEQLASLTAGDPVAEELRNRDVHAGFILILYSGSDHG